MRGWRVIKPATELQLDRGSEPDASPRNPSAIAVLKFPLDIGSPPFNCCTLLRCATQCCRCVGHERHSVAEY